MPKEGATPKFSQLYIWDTLNEVANRINAYSARGGGENLDTRIVEILKNMLDKCNPYVKIFRQAKERFDVNAESELKIRLVQQRGKDPRTHNLPTSTEVAALIVGDLVPEMQPRDILLETKAGKLQRISELHPAYLPLQYPMLFPRGEDGYMLDIPIGFEDTAGRARKTISLREFLCFRFLERENELPIIPRSGRLYQQISVDGYTMMESSRLQFVWHNQKKLRSDNYEAIQKSAAKGGVKLHKQGKRVFIPTSFTGGPRFFHQHYLDAMAICMKFGYPDFFITFTCNPKWPEIIRYVEKRNLTTEDRPDIVCRVFKMKLDSLMAQLTDKKGGPFGKCAVGMYTIEFQKRGLPHAHILLFLENCSKIKTIDQVDEFISAELPNKENEPDLFEVVSNNMLHGPCGAAKRDQVCMVSGKCTKHFPKPFTKDSKYDNRGFPAYRRRNDGKRVMKHGIELDNRYVIPYNKDLSLRYQAHINVEWCVQTRAIKYLFKYIHKGPDYVTTTIEDDDDDCVIDEIKRYYQCRYISPCESFWRIYEYPTQWRNITVERLGFHLENQQLVYFDEKEETQTILNKATMKESMFIAWMEANKRHPAGKNLTYIQYPSMFVWHSKTKSWEPRKQGRAIGRLAHVHPAAKEFYYLRILLNHVKGPECYKDIKTYDGVVYKTYLEACDARGLQDDDKEYISGIKEASIWMLGNYLRRFFAVCLLADCVLKPHIVWNETWEYLTDDILRKMRDLRKNPDLILSTDQIKHIALREIEDILQSSGKSLSRWTEMPLPSDFASYDGNRLLDNEKLYKPEDELREMNRLLAMITDEQRGVYNEILDAVLNDTGGVFFLYGFGGTGKTFLWKILSATLRSMEKIVVNTASSGIASLLLPGGRTAHSRFSIPINSDEYTSCNISTQSDIAGLLRAASLLVWDEAPMMSRHCFENLDRTMRDLIKTNEDKPFGGKVIVFGGDFRQILPVIEHGTRAQTVEACLNASYLWDHCKVLRLTKNMRLLAGLNESQAAELKEFSDWVLDVGNGNINCPNDGVVDIDIPPDLCVSDCKDPVETIISTVYGENFKGSREDNFYNSKAILSPTNEEVDKINNYMLDKLSGEEKTYYSADSIDPSYEGPEDLTEHPLEYLNDVNVPGFPKHKLRLKVGAPVMCLRNIDPKAGLCNGTRLVITQMAKHVLQAIIITDATNKDDPFVLIPRMYVTPPEGKFPFRMRRKQFPLNLAFAMTINKSQGQLLQNVGLFLPKPVFSHGQLYVALSRVKSRSGLKVLITDEEGNVQTKTTNVVYKEVFENLN